MQLALRTYPDFLQRQFFFLKNCLLGECQAQRQSDPASQQDDFYLYPRPMPLGNKINRDQSEKNKTLAKDKSNYAPSSQDSKPVRGYESLSSEKKLNRSNMPTQPLRKNIISQKLPYHRKELEEMGIFSSDFAIADTDNVIAEEKIEFNKQNSNQVKKEISENNFPVRSSTSLSNLKIGKGPAEINQPKVKDGKNKLLCIKEERAVDLDYPEYKTLETTKPAFFTTIVNWVLGLLLLAAVLVSVMYFGPQLYYSIFSPQVDQAAVDSKQQEEVTPLLALLEAEQNKVKELSKESTAAPKGRYLPEKNPGLPEEDLIIIPRISVNTALQRTETAEEALETGVWWVPDFGLPGDLDKPMIVAGHRFGWQWWWKTDYWKYHSFYKLTELEPGDRIEIISEQRRWIYEIYASEEGEEITDYQADLILYTCKHLNSPIRYFKYAKLVRDSA